MRARAYDWKVLRIFVVATLALGFGACTGEADAPNAVGSSNKAPPDTVAIVTADHPSPTSSAAHAKRAVAPPVVGCAARVEPSVEGFDGRRDVIRGPFAFVTLARDIPALSRASYRPRHGRLAGVKLPVGLRAGHRATLRVKASQRHDAALLYRGRTRNANRIQDGDRAVTFKPCQPDEPGFSGGTVGPLTGWAGSLIVTGPRCIRLEVYVDGRRHSDVRLPLGRRCR